MLNTLLTLSAYLQASLLSFDLILGDCIKSTSGSLNLAPWSSKWKSILFKTKLKYALPVHILLLLLSVLWLDSLYKYIQMDMNEKYESVLKCKACLLQRNVYITSANFVLYLWIKRVFSMGKEVVKNQDNMEVLKKQVAQSSKEYMRVLDKETDQTRQMQEMEDQVKEYKKKALDAEILAKQAQQQHDEYMRLADRYNELEKKLASSSDESRKSK